MNVGQLDRKVTLQTWTTSRDSFGQPVETWSDLAQVWAKKSDRVASEVTSGGQVVEVVRTVWTIRHRTDFDSRHRIKTQDAAPAYYYVTGVQEIGRRVGLKITTEKRDRE